MLVVVQQVPEEEPPVTVHEVAAGADLVVLLEDALVVQQEPDEEPPVTVHEVAVEPELELDVLEELTEDPEPPLVVQVVAALVIGAITKSTTKTSAEAQAILTIVFIKLI